MSKKSIVSSILSLTMCASVMTGATVALFTSENSANIAVTSGKVAVTAAVNSESLTLYSPTEINSIGVVTDADNAATEDGFANGGTASIEEGNLTLSNVVPGDKATFQIVLTNDSTVLVKYRTVVSMVDDNGLFDGLEVTMGSSYDGSETYSEWSSLTVAEKTKVVNCSVELPVLESALEENSCTIAFTVEAVQGNVTTYETVQAASVEELNAAVTNLEAPVTVELADGAYSFPTASLANKEVVFSGSQDTVFNMEGRGYGVAGATLTFNGVTITWPTSEGYRGLENPTKVVYKDCIINGMQCLYGDAEFINCTFTNYGTWSLWTYGATNVSFTGCTFNTDGHAVLNYNEGSNHTINLTMKNCVFNNSGDVSEQWGHEDLVENGDNPSKNNIYNLTFQGCVVQGEGTQNLWGNKNKIGTDRLTVIVDGVQVNEDPVTE